VPRQAHQSPLGRRVFPVRLARPQHARASPSALAGAFGTGSDVDSRSDPGPTVGPAAHRPVQCFIDQSTNPIATVGPDPVDLDPLVCLYPPSALRKRSATFLMATKKERRASALTIVPNALDQKGSNYGHFRPSDSGNSPGSLPVGLPARLPYGLPEPAGPDAYAQWQARADSSPKPAAPALRAAVRGRRRAGHGPARPRAFLREPWPFGRPPEADFGPLGMPLNLSEVARLIGCSPWTVRQTLIPRGLPHFQFKASGRLTSYRDQVIRWIESQQQGGPKHK
jgi:hypothetical protein